MNYTYTILLPNESTPVALYLTGQLPQKNRQGFYIVLMWLKRQRIFIPKDILKILFEAIEILQYNGSRIYKEEEVITNRSLNTDFLIMTVIGDDDGLLRFNSHALIKVSRKPIFIYLGGLECTQIRLEGGDFSVASYSLKSQYWSSDNIRDMFSGLHTVPLNQIVNNQLITYHEARLRMHKSEAIFSHGDWSCLDNFIHMGFLTRDEPRCQ